MADHTNIDCTKVKYNSEYAAEVDIKRIQKKSIRGRLPIRAYKCEHGEHWHITSKDDSLHDRIIELLKENKLLRDGNDEKLVQKCKEIGVLLAEVKALKIRNNKEVNLQVRTDEQIIALKKGIVNQKEEIKKLRNDKNNLFVTIVQLRNIIEKMNSENNE